MKKEIKLCLVYRDMWQSSGKYMPDVNQLCEIADPIVSMGCVDRVETNGGGFEQINLLRGENPNTAVRKWTQAFNDAGIQTQMLERGLNGIRMSPVPADVRKLMFKVKKKQGTDIARSFDGLNNPQNLSLSFQYAKEGGMIAQAALSLTFSPIHTVDYYLNLAEQYIELGAQEICIKDMAGIGRPVSIGKIIKGIRERHPDIVIQYHGHSTTGLSIASSLEAARNGADIIDVGMEPLSWGTGHADLISVHAMLKDAGFLIKDYDYDAYMEVRSLSKKFMDDGLSNFMNPQNRYLNSLILGPGLPGGMMGSLMADLENNLKSLNKWLLKRNKQSVSQEELLIVLFKEVEYVWPKLGYPPLVTPFSQYVKNVSLMNVLNQYKEKPRWSMIDENTWGMILGKSGKLPGPLGEEILNLAKEQNRSFYNGNPQDLYPDELDLFASKMMEKGWSHGTDDEELMEYAMHPQQYEEFKSGKAKERFQTTLQSKNTPTESNNTKHVTPTASTNMQASSYVVEIEGEKYKVHVKYDEGETTDIKDSPKKEILKSSSNGHYEKIIAPLEGKFYLTKDNSEVAKKIGDQVQIGDTIAYIESMKVINAITSDKAGIIKEIIPQHGQDVEEDDVIFKLG
ncbi:MAG: biotin/lipoyl-containing protein [Bacteroidota bacterium]